MSLPDRLDALQRRHPWASFPLAVVYKYIDDAGGKLAALIAYYAFVSLFPLLLLLSTVLGFLLAGDEELQRRLLDSALGQFPVVGAQLGTPKALSGGAVGLTVGILGSVYGGLGVAQTLQFVMNTAWGVPKNSRPNPLLARGRSLLLLVVIGLGLVGTTALSSVGAVGAGSLGPVLRVLVLIGSVLVNSAVFTFGFRIATGIPLTVRQVAPGAVAAAVVWQLLQTFGVVYVRHVVQGASASNGVFAVVLGLLAFLYVLGVAVVLCAEVNVVRVQRLYPRSLLTPLTDDVELTPGDRRTYTEQATSQRNKDFEEIDVTFHEPESSAED